MDNINLLPDDLQKEENKLANTGFTPKPVNLYIPQDVQAETPKLAPQPIASEKIEPKKNTEIHKQNMNLPSSS